MRMKKSEKSPVVVAIGKKIKEARLSAGLTQPELASSCGWFKEDGDPSQTRISNYENGSREAKAEELLRISKATRKSIAFFYGEVETTTPQSKNGQKLSAAQIRFLDILSKISKSEKDLDRWNRMMQAYLRE